jgi:4-amino-4-deoxy-L-arabinose transferase-like glycosyltransferase
VLRHLAGGALDARWVIGFALLVFGANLSVSQMRGDSMIYAAVSKNLLEAENPLQLTLNDEPYLNKPPLYFWITAGIMKLVGTGPVGVKLGALLISTLLCVVIYRSARRIFDDRTVGMLAVLVFSATYVVYRNTYHARMESLITLCVFSSLMCFWRWMETRRMSWILGWGLLAGMAVLTKGPVGLLPIGAGVTYLAVRERGLFRGRGSLQIAAGLAVFVASFLWWYLYAAQSSELLTVLFGDQLLDRSVLGTSQAVHRWWSVYLAKLVSYDLIWMVAAVIGIRRAWTHENLRRPVGLLCTAALLHLIMIHLVEEKSARYLYQFYVFTAGLSAFGILSIKRFDAEHALKIVIVVFAVMLQFVPPSSGRNYYGVLEQAVVTARNSGWAMVADWRDFEALDEQAALDYYLEDSSPPEILPGSFILVRPRDNPMPQARTLFTTDRLWIGVVLGGPHGPGEVKPMTQSTPALEGS